MRKMTNSAGLTGAHADLDDQPAHVARLGRVQLFVALDIERLRRARAKERPVAPDRGQEGRDVAPDPAHRNVIVGLKDHPLGAALDRLFDIVEQPPHVDVAPGRVARQRAGTPDADAPPGEGADAVDAIGVEGVLLALGRTCRPGRVRRSTTSLAGALCTPRVLSLRAQMPAMCPQGGMLMGRFRIGSSTWIQG